MNGFSSSSRFAEISHTATSAHLRVPLFGSGHEPSAILAARYHRADPLVVWLDVRTPEGGTVFSRVVLRADVIAGMDRFVGHADTRIGPSAGEVTEIRFRDAGAVVALRIPTPAARRFLRFTERIVPVDREADVLGELAASLASNLG